MAATQSHLVHHVLKRIDQIQLRLGLVPIRPAAANDRFADLLDSMGMVELLGLLADDCDVAPSDLEECVQRRFGTVAELADAMIQSDFAPAQDFVATPQAATSVGPRMPRRTSIAESVWLAGVTSRLPF